MTQKKQPNVLWVFVDQMRAQAMSHRGDKNINTPNLDRLATEGVNFTHAISGTPLCTPFRGSLLTGKHPNQSGVSGLNSPLSTEIPTVAHAFNDHGYETCWIGKWHLDGDRPELDLNLEENKKNIRKIPKERRGGFSNWWAYENNNQPFNCWIHTDQDDEMISYRLPSYETDDLTDLCLDWISDHVSNKEKPFFATISVQPPHDPYVAPEECLQNYNPAQLNLRPNVPPVEEIEDRARVDLAGYYAAIERIDWNLGRIRKKLRELGIDQDTYIMFFSDHGDMHGSHGQFRKQAPWDESIRVPFLVGGPTRKNHLTKSLDYLINHVDIAPTTLGLCGIKPPDSMVGFDYSKYILDDNEVADETVPDSAYLSLPEPTASLTSIVLEEGVDRPYRGIITRDGMKYVVLENQAWLLFNLNNDPYEQVNLAHSVFYKEKREQLQEILATWIKDTDDSFPLPTID